MAPVWELCAESAHLNDQSLKNLFTVPDSQDLLVASTISKRHKRRSHRRKHDRETLNRRPGCLEDAVDQNRSTSHYRTRGSGEVVYNYPRKTHDYVERTTTGKFTNTADGAPTSTQNRDSSNKNSRRGDRKLRNSERGLKFDDANVKQSHETHHQYHCRKNNQQHCDSEEWNKNGRLAKRNKLSEYYTQHKDCDIAAMQLRRRRCHHGGQQNQRAVTWIDENSEAGFNKSLNKRGNLQANLDDKSNNWLYGLFSNKKEDPRQTEERFYGGLESTHRSNFDKTQKGKKELEMRFRRAQSPDSTFLLPPVLRPGQKRAVATEKQDSGYDADTMANLKILGVSTNDPVTGKHLLGNKTLPYGSFKTVSLLLDSPKFSKHEDVSVYLTAHDMPSLATRLQPFVPFDTATAHLKSPHQSYEDEAGRRLPPVQFRPEPDTVKGPLPKPFHHPGIAWPLAFATKPPYACPGHECPGVKQPVGVVQTGVVPVRPLQARAWELDTEIPAWVSPLYKTYGIAGPYGRHGPFAEPTLMQSDARWNYLLRQAEDLGALDMPGVITDGGRLDLSGLCGGYVQLRKEHEAMLARQRQWSCKSCTKFKEWVRKVKKKLGMKVDEKVVKQRELRPTAVEGTVVPWTGAETNREENVSHEQVEAAVAPPEEGAAPAEATPEEAPAPAPAPAAAAAAAAAAEEAAEGT